MTELMHYAFIDETGNIIFSSENHFLIVAALGTNNRNSISRIIRNTQKKFGASLSSGELKAKKESAFLIRHVLTLLSKEPIQIFTVVVDKKILNLPLKDPEEIYRWTISRLISMVVKKYPKVEIVLDRRYTNEHLRLLLEISIREEISNIPRQIVIIRQEDSTSIKELQAVDFIAWALYQKYEHNDVSFYEMISSLIIEEEIVSKQSWYED